MKIKLHNSLTIPGAFPLFLFADKSKVQNFGHKIRIFKNDEDFKFYRMEYSVSAGKFYKFLYRKGELLSENQTS